MEKNILKGLLMVLVLLSAQVNAQTAKDFNVKDCAGTDRHLYAELEAGKVVVMSMVHPCISCVNPTKTAIDVVNTFASSHPGKVIFYLTDDAGNTPCSSLNSWASTYNITGVPIISDVAVNQSDYGSSGMPKIVVIGGGVAHKIYLNQDNSIDASTLSNAINSALLASGINEAMSKSRLSFYPNPVQNEINLSINLPVNSNIRFEILNLIGLSMQNIPEERYKAGVQNINLSAANLPNGVYFLKIWVNEQYLIYKFNVSR